MVTSGRLQRPTDHAGAREELRTRDLTSQPPDLRPSYPHFGRGDADVWEQWLWDHQDQIRHVYYDIALGGVTIDDPDIDQTIKDGWKYSTACKIDAVAVLEAETLVCEVKPFAHMGAVGQALGYSMLLQEDPLNDLPIIPTIICTRTTRDVTTVAEALGIRLDVVTL